MLDGWNHGFTHWLDYRTYDFFGKIDGGAKTKRRSTNYYFNACATLFAVYFLLEARYENNLGTTTERYTADECLTQIDVLQEQMRHMQQDLDRQHHVLQEQIRQMQQNFNRQQQLPYVAAQKYVFHI